MGKIHAMMDTGRRSMQNSQTALQTVAHNIASKNVEGFSRQRVETVTAPPVSEGKLQLGMGARAAQITRVNNPFLEKQLQDETGQKGYLDSQAEALSRVEHVFNEEATKGLNQYMSDFFNAFRELANTPESLTSRTLVKESAAAMTNDFSRVQGQLKQIQKDVDGELRGLVQEVNSMTKEIASLNQEIVGIEVLGNPANDQRDRRDLLVKKLNERMDIKVAEGERGSVVISTAGNGLIVSGVDHVDVEVSENPATQKVELYVRPTESHPPLVISDRIKGGKIGGLLGVRDKTVEQLRSKVDELAYGIATQVNALHMQGVDGKSQPGNLFFDHINSVEGAAENLRVSDAVERDVTKIAVGYSPDSPGDNRIANQISLLQYKQTMDGDSSTFDDFYNSQVGRLGVVTQQANKDREAQDDIITQASQLRESISGVSLDEEATKMIEFQKAFEASARLIKTADEMFDTVLNLKRL